MADELKKNDNLEKKDEITETQIDEQSNEVFILESKDIDKIVETNTHWEIQKVKPFSGGSVCYNECYRFKHIGTGKFLVV